MKKYLLFALLLGTLTNVRADSKVAIIDLYGSNFCPGASFPIVVEATGVFQAGNIFSAVLSDSTGLFGANMVGYIGSDTAWARGRNTILVTIPLSTPPGTGYRIRVVSTSPVDTSANNGENLIIQPTPQVPFLTQAFGCPPQLAITGAGSNPYSITWWALGQDSTLSLSTTWQPATIAGGNGEGSNLNQLSLPDAVFVDRAGNIYVSDNINERVLKFPAGSTSATNGIVVAGGNGAGAGPNQLNGPDGLFVDGIGNLYVADLHNQRVKMFPAGSTSATNGLTVAGGNGQGNAANQLWNPVAIFVDGGGNLYVANGNRVQLFPLGSDSLTNGYTVAGGATSGSGTNQMNTATAVFVDAGGYIYVADQGNYRVQQFPPDGDSTSPAWTVAGGNGQGSANNQFQALWGMYIDAHGDIYVSDAGATTERVLLFPPGSDAANNGITIAGGNGQGSNANQLYNPEGVFVDGNGNLYVADLGNNRIQEFTPTPPSPVITPNIAGTWAAYYSTWAGCYSAYTNTDTVQLCTGINTIAAPNNISLYPNPNTGSFILTSASVVGQTCIISDMVGRVIKQLTITADEQQLDLGNISAGTYILVIKGGPGIKFTVE